MQGFHVEEPALHLLDIFGLVGHDHSHALFSPSFKQEGLLSLHDFAAKLQPPPISSSPQYSISKQVNHRRPDFPYVGSSCLPAEINNRGMNALGNMLVPSAEKKQTLIDEYACRGMPHMGGTTEGNGVSDVGNASISTTTEASKGAAYVGGKNGYSNKQGGEHISAPLTSAKDDHMLRFSSFEGSDADRVQDSIAAFLNCSGQPGRFGEHIGNEGIYMNNLHASMAALTCDSPSRDDPLWRFLPSNNQKHNVDFVSSDDFCMYEFKVRRCMRGRSHDWTECPFAHPGEKARRRDPRCFNYSGTACPDFRRGTCRKGDLCEFSHGVFECWLHPARYRTQLCKDGKACKRRVCFFAHSASQLRIVSPDKSGQFSLKMPFTSSTDDISCYFDAPHKQPTLITRQASSVGHGRVNGYGADRFLDDFSPKSMHRFSQDGVQDEVTIMSEHRHSLNHNEKAPHDRDLETCSVKCSYVHHGGSFKDLQKTPDLNSPQDHRHHYFPVLIGDDCQYESSTGNSYCSTDSTPPSPLDSSSWKSDANFKSHFALSNLKGGFDQIMSPTSTLVRNIFSPPPLSPPLSPSKSPPMSPGMALPPWGTVSRKKVSRAAHPLPYDAFTHCPTPGMDVTHASILANLPNSNYGPSAHACTHGPSPLSATTKGNRRHDHLDGFHAMQSAMGIQDDGVQTPSIEENAPMHAMVHLISTLQQMELRHVAASADIKSKKRSLLQRMESPKSRLEAGHAEGWAPYDLGSVQGPESGQGFRGKTNGNYAKEDVENPDFGWVNELVK